MERRDSEREIFSSADHILYRLHVGKHPLVSIPAELEADDLVVEPDIIDPHESFRHPAMIARDEIAALTHAQQPLTEQTDLHVSESTSQDAAPGTPPRPAQS